MANAKKSLNAKSTEPKLNLIYGLILLGYSFITVLTPNLNTLDSNGSKFYTLAILNLIAYAIIIIGNQVKPQKDFHWSFFRTWIGIVYTLFLLISLLSFFKAFNIYESIINFSKLFTIFSAAYIIAIILRKDKRYLYIISVALTLLLVVDCFTVFYHIATNLMEGKGANIIEIKSVYSNKNILASAIFVKISFALWLVTFSKGWMKMLGGFTLSVAFIATLFMSTRSFYIGFIFLFITYVPFMFIYYSRKLEKRKVVMQTIYFSAAVIIVVSLFSIGLKYLYPSSSGGVYAADFITRLKTISLNASRSTSEGLRITAWKNSFKLIKENPLLGIGTGNWKIEVLKYETPTTGAYIYMYKNHNDFIETMVDIGVFGGILFLGIFLLIFANFMKAFFKAKKEEEESYKWLFLPAFGLFCYSFDAFFNFPSDRPEIISFFAIFVGAGIAFSPIISRFSFPNSRSENPEASKKSSTRSALNFTSSALITVILFLMFGSIYIFYLNFKSLKLQRIAKQEMLSGTLTSPSEIFMQGFPAIPNISIEGEPIVVTKARYLISEQKYQQAIDLLKEDNSSPYDTRPEFFIAMAFLKLGLIDSALFYSKKVYELKPFFSGNASLMSSAYETRGNLTEALKVLDDHIQMNNTNNQPVSDALITQHTALASKVRIQRFQDVFDKAVKSFGQKEYNTAIKYF